MLKLQFCSWNAQIAICSWNAQIAILQLECSDCNSAAEMQSETARSAVTEDDFNGEMVNSHG